MAIRRGWILGSFGWDAALILFPGLLAAAVVWLAPEGSVPSVWMAFAAIIFIDTGHQYVTLWRTIFRRQERTSHPIYWVTPFLILLGMTAWFWLRLPYAWAFVVYVTVYHHIRQYYGMLRWYERLNGRRRVASESFLYALSVLPFVLLHVRPLPAMGMRGLYTDQDLFLAPHPGLYRIGLVIYGAVVAAWLLYELALWRRGVREINRSLAVLAPAVVQGGCFLLGRSLATIVVPLLIAHGIPYLAIISLSLTRVDPRGFRTLAKAAAVVLASVVVFGLMEWVYEERWLVISNAYVHAPIAWLQGVLLAVYLVPPLSHYVFDAHIWTGKHREAKLVYALPGARDPIRA